MPIHITEPGFTGPSGAKFPEFGPPLKEVPALTAPIDFLDPNTILHFGWGGYTRNALRPDGKIVTIYYWQEDEKAERDIAATLWTPPTRSTRQSGK